MSGNLSEENLGSDAFFSPQGKFYFFQSLNSKVIPDLSISSIKKWCSEVFRVKMTMYSYYDVNQKKKLAKSGVRTHADRAGLDLKSKALTTRPTFSDCYFQKNLYKY